VNYLLPTAHSKAEVLRERLLEAVQARQAKDAKKQAKAAAKLPLDEGLASPRSPPGTSRRHRSLSSLQDGAKVSAANLLQWVHASAGSSMVQSGSCRRSGYSSLWVQHRRCCN